MEELKDIEIIDRYMDGSLTDSEKQLVENRLANDTTFRQTYDEVNEAVLAVKLAGEDKIWAIMREEQAKLAVSRQSSVVSRQRSAISHEQSVVGNEPSAVIRPNLLRGYRTYLAAASVALLCVVGFFILTKPKETPFDFKQKPNAWVITDRGKPTQSKQQIIDNYGRVVGEKIIEGLSLYENDQFTEAASTLLSVNLQNDTLFLFQANALMKANNGTQAIAVLDKIASNSPVATEKDWYLAMAYMQVKDLEKAKILLKSIAENQNSDWQSEALKMLQKAPFGH